MCFCLHWFESMTFRGLRLNSSRCSSLTVHRSDEHLTCFPEAGREAEREKGHLMGRMDGKGDGAGGRARGRSGRQLLGHCLPGVCTSVISQPLSSLATYRHRSITQFTLAEMHPTQHRFLPCTSLPPSLSASTKLTLSGAGQSLGFIYIDTVTSWQHLQHGYLVFGGQGLVAHALCSFHASLLQMC